MTAILHNIAPPKRIDDYLYPSKGPFDDWDAEMDVPEPTNPETIAELSRLDATKLETSPEQNIEWALQKYEENYHASKPQRWAGQERWQGRENEEMRLTRIMHPHTFMRRLRSAGVDARIEDDPYGRLWLNSFSRKGRIGITAWVIDEQQGRKVKKTITTLQYPYGPEFSIMRFNDYNVPTAEKYRGWRTALLNLILTRVVTEAEALKAFGPCEGAAADFYRQQLKGIRSLHLGLRLKL